MMESLITKRSCAGKEGKGPYITKAVSDKADWEIISQEAASAFCSKI